MPCMLPDHSSNTRQKPVQTQAQAIREALDLCMGNDKNVIVVGEGVPDPKGIFGTTSGLMDKYGPSRVFDMPLSENGMTGICIGASLSGMRPVMVHQRIEFALLAMDQIINNAAKWNYMFAGQNTVPLVIRMIIGRGWGQGPQHSQSLQSLFSHIPGLKVVMPVTAQDAKGMLISAIEDDNPVIFIEHRWLHPVTGEVSSGYYRESLDKAKVVRTGQHITVAAYSYMVLEALEAAHVLAKQHIEVEVIDMRSARPVDIAPVLASVKKTGHLVVADTGHITHGIAAEVISQVVERGFSDLNKAPVRISSPDYPVPTSPYAANDYYPEAVDIARAILTIVGCQGLVNEDAVVSDLQHTGAKDIPNPQFHGPF